MKVSICCTVFNEESSIAQLLESLISQSRKPDEIIIVDGGSTDKTIEIISSYIEKCDNLKLLIAKDANVAQGRNLAISNSKYDIVASTDAGCIADKDWLQNLSKNFDPEIDIVTGICLPDARNTFEECFADMLYPKIDDWKADWPSHQNIAFRKYVWENIKYPDKCYRSEDTWFNINARKKGYKYKLAKDAIIHWRPRKNLWEVFKNSYMWTKSNIENNVRPDDNYDTKIVLNDLKILSWRLMSLIMLIIVFVFISRWGAILLSPFIIKNVINLYRDGNKISITKMIYKNLIYYTDILAHIFGFIAGKIAIRK